MGRDFRGRFKLGTSGNPGGRPKSSKALSAIIQNRTEEILEALFGILHTGRPQERLKACEILLDRAFGKAAQIQEIKNPAQQPIEIIINSKPKPDRLQLQQSLHESYDWRGACSRQS